MNTSLFVAGVALALTACTTTSVHRSGAATAPAVIAPVAAASPTARTSDPGALIAASATAMLGQPYRYGGAEPGGFDCSGLVVYAAARAGLHVPRTAHDQLDTGVRVARSDLRAGDLVFMHLSHKELHVGIAIDHERFVHAPSAGGHVRIDSLSAPPYARGFIKARRIVDN